MDVSVIIVNYNTRELSLQCLDSIFEHTNQIEFEIIVVDNASVDGSCEAIKNKFPTVILIEAKENLGFGGANNLGIKSAKGKYLLLLNSDCLLLENTIKVFYDFMEQRKNNDSIGAIGAVLLDRFMKQSYSVHRFPTFFTEAGSIFSVILSRISKKLYDQLEEKTILRNDNMMEVECILGADIFISRNVFNLLGGFDEQFFLYFEETDLQKRMSDAGMKRIILSDQKIIHYGEGSSVKTSPSLKKWTRFNESRFRYCKKHWTGFNYWIFYMVMFPVLCYPLLNHRYPKDERTDYLNMLLRKPRAKLG